VSSPAGRRFHEGELGRVHCLEAGVGVPTIWLQEQPAVSSAHELLSEHFRILAVPAGAPAEVDPLLGALGSDQLNLIGTGAGAENALRLALSTPERVSALVLESPQLLLSGDNPSLEEAISHLEVPTLAIFGSRDPNIPPDHGARYRALMPDCYYVLVYKAGATVAEDRPNAFAGLVADFLTRREAFVVSNQSEKLTTS
jgi:pimeloyl-ACP methyl ester carboxylesterase